MRIININYCPKIKHQQKLNPRQAEKFLQEVKSWLQTAKRKIYELQSTRFSKELVLSLLEVMSENLLSIYENLKWLEKQNYSKPNLEKEIIKELQEMQKEIEKLNQKLKGETP
jgi:hypothetical protein